MATKKYETIKVEKEDGITWVIFNRPDKRNAMSPQLHLDMDDALDDLATDRRDPGAGASPAPARRSAPGQDIKLYFRGTETDPPRCAHKARRASNQWRWQKLSTFPKPTIAMVNGFCFGGALHAGLRLRLRDRGRRRDVRPVGGELGHPAGRHRVVERRADPELSATRSTTP